MKRRTADHPKTIDLCSRLGVERYSAVGILELLWHFTAEFAPAGDIGRYADSAIANAIHWTGSVDKLVRELIESKWIDVCPVNRLIVHDWCDHADDYTRKKLKRANKSFVSVCLEMSGQSPDKNGNCPDFSRLPVPVPVPVPEPPAASLLPFRSAKIATLPTVKIPDDHEGFDFASWVAARIKAHPTGCSKRVIQGYFSDRLFSADGFTPTEFATVHDDWVAYWKEPNSSFPVGLDKFIFDDWWRKPPPRKARDSPPNYGQSNVFKPYTRPLDDDDDAETTHN